MVKFTTSSFERQILESVKIQENRGHHRLNSKSEYNRCAIPRLAVKLGNNDFKAWAEEEKEERKKDLEINEKVRQLIKERRRQENDDEDEEEDREKDHAEEKRPSKRRKFEKDCGMKDDIENDELIDILKVLIEENEA